MVVQNRRDDVVRQTKFFRNKVTEEEIAETERQRIEEEEQDRYSVANNIEVNDGDGLLNKGFYYEGEFSNEYHLKENKELFDLVTLNMNRIIKENQLFERLEVSLDFCKELFKYNKYKLENTTYPVLQYLIEHILITIKNIIQRLEPS